MIMDNTTHLVILAAGKGKRMNSDLPKVLLPLNGKPLLRYLLESVSKSSLVNRPTIVVGVGSGLVKKEAGPQYQYVVQEKQLGTGHAVLCTEESLRGKAENIMVLYGDHPLVDSETIDKVVRAHRKGGNVLTMATAKVKDFNDWRAGFFDYGRILRNGEGEIKRIVEKKDATEEELKTTEVNPSYFCFRADWLWEKLKLITTDNAQHEYYLTVLPKMAWDEGLPVTTVSIDPVAALGTNTPDQLAVLEKILREKA